MSSSNPFPQDSASFTGGKEEEGMEEGEEEEEEGEEEGEEERL